MNFNKIIKLKISKDDVLNAIKKATEQVFIDNFRERHINIQFDSKLCGYIGEFAQKRWFSENEIDIKTTNYFDEEYGMDIDFEYKGLELELKTSLIPDADGTLFNVFNRCDLKIIRRSRKIEDLKGDIHIQILFDRLTKKKDEWLIEQKINLNSNEPDYLFDTLLGKAYLNKTYLLGWMDKTTLKEKMNKLKGYEKSWRFDKRRFWVCKLSECHPPKSLIKHLNEK